MHRNLKGSYDGGKIAGLYDLEETLGRGHFAVVKLARHVFTGEKVAVKVIDKTKLDEVSRAHLFQEVRCMKLVQHPNVVRLYEVIDTHSKLYLILELADGGDLYDYIMRHESGLSEMVAQEYFSQIVRAISYCHKLHVVHRDLKPENVVFFERFGVVKLTDFGFSNKFYPGQKLETSCGSLAYSAPEILLGDSYDAPAVDIWSLGVILYMLVCGQAPFQEANDSETLTMIMDCKYTVPDHISEDCKKLIARMLVRKPENRATLEEIANDPWLMNTQSDSIAVPLISRQTISDEDHATIVQRMVNGEIATKEQILEALDKNAYNHITATYYLLAERKLRSLKPKNKQSIKNQIPLVSVDSCSSEAENTFPAPSSNFSLLARPGLDLSQRSRKCSIVAEEEEEEDDGALSDSSLHNSSSWNRRGSRSEGKLNITVQEIYKESLPGTPVSESSIPGTPSGSSFSRSRMLPPPLVSARSSPQLGLDEIFENCPSGAATGSTCRLSASSSTQRSSLVNFEQRRSRFHKSRTASCSSSEASGDEENESRKKRGSQSSLRQLRGNRRDPDGGAGSAGGPDTQPPHSGSSDATQGPDPAAGSCDQANPTGSAASGTSAANGRKHSLGSVVRYRRRMESRLRESQSLNCITEVQEAAEQLQPVPSILPPLIAVAARRPAPGEAKEEDVETVHDRIYQTNLIRRFLTKRNRLKHSAIVEKWRNLQRKFCGLPFAKRNRDRLYKAHSEKEVNRVVRDINQNVKSTTTPALDIFI